MVEVITDCEVLRVMIDGGCRLCQDAKKKWVGNYYQLPDQRSEALNRWREMETRVHLLAKKIREAGLIDE